MEKKLLVSRLTCDAFMICSDYQPVIDEMKSKIISYTEAVEDGKYDLEPSKLITEPRIYRMDQRGYEIVDLNIEFIA